jgi:glutaredoxin-related protein
MTVKMYGIRSCPDVRATLAMFEKNGIMVDFRDFNENIVFLKEFLSLRDRSPLFDNAKSRGNIGIPCFVAEDGAISFDPDKII